MTELKYYKLRVQRAMGRYGWGSNRPPILSRAPTFSCRPAIKRRIKGRHAESELKELLSVFSGRWVEKGKLIQFHADGGAVLNWWPGTGTIQIQGPAQSAAEFELLLLKALK